MTEPRCAKCKRTPEDGATFAPNPLRVGGHYRQCDDCRAHKPRTPRRKLTGPEITRVCSRCGEEMPATTEFFPPNAAYHNGLHRWCRACVSANAERRRKERMATDEEFAAKQRKRVREYARARYARLKATNAA